VNHTVHRTPSSQVGSPDSGELHDRLIVEQVKMMCQFALIPFVGTLFIGGVLCKILMAGNPRWMVLAWFAVLVTLSGGRAGIARRFLVGSQTAKSANFCAAATRILAAVSGLTWAFGAIFLLPTDPAKQMIVLLFYTGAIASAVATLSPIRFGYASLLIPFLVPFAIAKFIQGGPYIAVGYGVLLYIVMMLYISRTYRNGIREILQLRLANEELAQRLGVERNSIAAINEDLKRQIAERQLAETRLIAAKAEAEAASRAKSQFLANMSHEVRTPMNAMLGMTELLMRTPLDTRQRHFAQVALESGQSLLHLIDDLLDLSRIEAGKLTLRVTDFSARDLLREVVDLMTPQAAAKGLKLTQAIGPRLPDLLRGDASRLRQVLVNLISNAIKFTERGSIAVELNIVATPAASASREVRLRYSITDTGIGIAEDARSRLFKPFSQADESTTRRFGGSGLGLAICREVVEAMNGEIGFESEMGRGSSFWFELDLPVAEPVHTREVANVVTAAAPAKMSGEVLVVEDNAVNRTLLAETLTMLGLNVSMAENGRQALAQLERQHFDVVLMDWHMPEVDGVEAARRIRAREAEIARPGFKPLTIIALTASAMPGDSDACLDAGMDGYIAKPFMFDEIVEVLRRSLPQSASLVA
jgi:signal transduction histidine kinase/ActR/RegA family two-component response regulator